MLILDADKAILQVENFALMWCGFIMIIIYVGLPMQSKFFKIWTTAHFAYLGLYPKRTKTLLRLIEPIRHLSPSVWRLLSLPFKLFGHKQYSMFNYLKILVDTRDIVRQRSSLSIHLSHEISSAMNDIVSGESLVLPNCSGKMNGIPKFWKRSCTMPR